MIWMRSNHHSERLVREFLLNQHSCSETAISLASKLGLSRRGCRRALEQLVDEGVVRRREFSDIEPIYYRYPLQ
jgi:predicted ArsR family transcriptional regulator